MVCLGYHSYSCLTQRLTAHKHAESVVYLLPYNNIILLLEHCWSTVGHSREKTNFEVVAILSILKARYQLETTAEISILQRLVLHGV